MENKDKEIKIVEKQEKVEQVIEKPEISQETVEQERTFTQEEVNKIVSIRVEREKSKSQAKEMDIELTNKYGKENLVEVKNKIAKGYDMEDINKLYNKVEKPVNEFKGYQTINNTVATTKTSDKNLSSLQIELKKRLAAKK